MKKILRNTLYMAGLVAALSFASCKEAGTTEADAGREMLPDSVANDYEADAEADTTGIGGPSGLGREVDSITRVNPATVD